MEQFLMEKSNLKQAFAPVDLNTAAITGARVSLKEAKRVAIALSLGSSTAAEVRVTLRQHDAASGGTSKNLEIANRYFHKAGAATVFTEVEPSVAAALYNLDAIFAANGGIVVFEVLAEDLDVNGGFDHISVDIADAGAAKIGAGIYVLHNLDIKPGYEVAI
jgi:hypothetical protein